MDFVNGWSARTEIPVACFIRWLGIGSSKFYEWRRCYGKVHEHHGWIPRDFWLEPWERQAIIDYFAEHPEEGYRVTPLSDLPGSHGVTDANGRFCIGALESSSYSLMATHKDYGTARVHGIENNSDRVVITLPSRSILAIAVRDACTRLPVQEFEAVLLGMPSHSLTTPIRMRSPQGVAEIPIDPALLRTPLFLRITSKGYLAYDAPVDSGTMERQVDLVPEVTLPVS